MPKEKPKSHKEKEEDRQEQALEELELAVPGRLGIALRGMRGNLKNYQTLYFLLCIISLVATVYMDYRSSVSRLDTENDEIERKADTIEDKATDADTSRVEVDKNLQNNMKLMLDHAISIENRLATLEEKTRRLEDDNSSLIRLLLGGGNGTTVSSDEGNPVAAGDPGVTDPGHKDDKAAAIKITAPVLEFEEPEQVFKD